MIEFETTLFELILVIFLILINSVFVAIEFAIIRIRTSELDVLIQQKNYKAINAREVKNHLDRYISAAQLGITLINLLLGWIGESIFSKLFNPLFSLFGINSSLSSTAASIIGILVLTFLTLTIGEIAPKAIAIRYSKSTALWFALPLRIFYRIFKPFIWLLNVSANALLRVIGVEPVTKDEVFHSEEELRFLISEGRKTGIIDSTEHQLIEKIFEFNDKLAREIMVPRSNMVAIDIDDRREKIIQIIIDEGYSRIPVFKENIDNIIGILYSKDLISAAEHRDLIVLHDILRPAQFVPETTHIGDLLKEFQKKHIHLGIVVNEHGGVEGLITLEDILEEIVGEIEDEYDIDTKNIEKDKLGLFLVNPIITIEEFNKRFKIDIPENADEYQTLSGFLQNVTGHVPEIYERIDYKGFIFTVTKKSGNKLLQIKIQRMAS